jgi:hypothetical protein
MFCGSAIRRACHEGRPSCCALMPMVAAAPTSPATPLPRRPANARGHEQIQQATQLTNSVAKNASGDKLPGTTKCRRDTLSPTAHSVNPKEESTSDFCRPKRNTRQNAPPRRVGASAPTLPSMKHATGHNSRPGTQQASREDRRCDRVETVKVGAEAPTLHSVAPRHAVVATTFAFKPQRHQDLRIMSPKCTNATKCRRRQPPTHVRSTSSPSNASSTPEGSSPLVAS